MKPTDKMRPVERHYRRAVTKMKRNRYVKPENKKLEEDISYLMNEIESYGFKFFPNHYIYEMVTEFSNKVDRLVDSQAA